MTAFLYRSTRSDHPTHTFRDVTLAGLAPDGGLYLPEIWPQFTPEEWNALQGKSFQDVAHAVLLPFVAGSLSDSALHTLITKAWAGFRAPEVAPLRDLEQGHHVLELFHGPTLAFKDVALQLLGHLFEHFLTEISAPMTILGATSGDTGSAAIAATAHRRNITTFILYPHGRTSEIQRKQMTCVDAPNVHALAVEGTFDDCQAIVKALFTDQAFRERHNLAAVNSINWARLLAQMAYYVYASVRLSQNSPCAPSFVVPTGNFGNVFAGYAAHLCGLPVSRLVVATNRNDILTRFFATGTMESRAVAHTLSPSMDIQISSNFERLLFMMTGGDTALIRDAMRQQKEQGLFHLAPPVMETMRALFRAARADDAETLATIKAVYTRTGMILDPHTAVGVRVAEVLRDDLPTPIVTLATAHPAKFPEAIKQAIGVEVAPPDDVQELLRKPERTTVIPATLEAVRAAVEGKG